MKTQYKVHPIERGKWAVAFNNGNGWFWSGAGIRFEWSTEGEAEEWMQGEIQEML